MLKTVIAREFKTLLHTKAQIISTIFVILLIVAGGLLWKYFNTDESNETAEKSTTTSLETVALAPEMKDFKPILEDTGMMKAEIITAEKDYAKWLREAAEKENSPSIVLAGTPDMPQIIQYGESAENSKLTKIIQQSATVAQANRIAGKISPEDSAKLVAAMNIPITTVTGSNNLIRENPIGFISATITQIFIIFAVVMGVNTVSSGVVEEKNSRVIEILLSTIRPRVLLLGKIIGIGLFVLCQVAVYVITAIIMLNVANLWQYIDFNTIFIWMFLWIIVGFFIYTSYTGGISAMVSRQEELGAVIAPSVIMLLIPYYFGMFFVPEYPDSIWTKIISLIPGFSSFIMPLRQAYGSVTQWELFLALGIGIIAIPLLAAFSGKIYENSILRMGKRVTWREALKKS